MWVCAGGGGDILGVVTLYGNSVKNVHNSYP